MDKNDIIEYVMNTPHNTNRAVLSSMLNQLTEGDGGSSDFSTAQMTIINTVEDSLVNLTGVRVDTQTNELFSDDELGYGTTTVIVVLYKGNAKGSIGAEEITSTTGDIVLDENAEYVISGDCTVTVKGYPWE